MADTERVELERLLADLDADEAEELRPATEQAQARALQLTAEKARLEAQATALARIVAEQEGALSEVRAHATVGVGGR